MTPAQVLDLFASSGALLEGHFQLSSGLHSAGYLQCALVLQHPDRATALGAALGGRVRRLRVAAVMSPALGGVVIGQEVARALGVRALFAERRDGQLTLRRGFRLEPNERVLIVEDVVTTGGSTRETIGVAAHAGGDVVGAVSVINRGGPSIDLGVPFEALAEIAWPAHPPATCPLCADGMPLTKPGSRPESSPCGPSS